MRDRLGPPPKNPEQLALWATRFAAEVLWAEAQGLIGRELAASLRAGVGTVARAPATRAGDWLDEDDDFGEPEGPQLEEIEPGNQLRVEPALRVDPR